MSIKKIITTTLFVCMLMLCINMVSAYTAYYIDNITVLERTQSGLSNYRVGVEFKPNTNIFIDSVENNVTCNDGCSVASIINTTSGGSATIATATVNSYVANFTSQNILLLKGNTYLILYAKMGAGNSATYGLAPAIMPINQQGVNFTRGAYNTSGGTLTYTLTQTWNLINLKSHTPPVEDAISFNYAGIVNNTFTYDTSPVLRFNATTFGNWNVTLYLNTTTSGTAYNLNTSYNSNVMWSPIINTTLTKGREHQWWFSAQSNATNQINTSKYNIFIAGVYPVLGMFVVQPQCSVYTVTNGYYIQ